MTLIFKKLNLDDVWLVGDYEDFVSDDDESSCFKSLKKFFRIHNFQRFLAFMKQSLFEGN